MADPYELLKQSLTDLHYPATKQEIAAHAEQAGADPETRRVLRGLPLATYENLPEVLRSVRLRTADEEGLSASDKVAHSRSKHSHKVAEYLRDVD
ncbi:MAG: DUF2795 domain-containing protein [Hamadaea sp.]|uniref:DUF2795 domain-containing protein n=1 Tax=Hamadaea sp. TaxID=2024425 RepID=UPI0017B423FE|nr:DUF2795 domain-containing protein [Hamadaea sp.]NUR72187.1 DUF2795 domain-containing protein [Hamadaea sp.]NUT18604.1 DUF2795 domain-containing protein [Hamadaea sp.]